MKNRRFTKVAFALSICLLVLWGVLGTGTSIAWFMDETPELVNTFDFGELDLEVYYKTTNAQGHDEWVLVDEKTKVFDEEALYEPGYTQVVYLKIVNKGDVEFDYKLSVNMNMQAYMVEKKQGKPVDEEVEDKVIGNYRALVQEKREIGSQSQRRVITALYSACTFLAVVVLAIGVTMMNNYDKMKSMEAVLNSLSQNIAGESKSGEEQRPTVAANVVVENVEGNVKPTTSGMTQTTPEAMSQAEAAAGQSTETQTLSQTAEQTSEAAAETAASVMEPRAGIYHIVEEGETLTAISVAVYHTDTMVSAIKEANGIEDENKIYPGQEIYLP